MPRRRLQCVLCLLPFLAAACARSTHAFLHPTQQPITHPTPPHQPTNHVQNQ
jgi:hypothetical protein